MTTKLFGIILLSIFSSTISAQKDTLPDINLDDLIDNSIQEFSKNAFKSTRVINGQSMEMLGKGVLDLRILHRFGLITDGPGELFGLDQASMRLGFDYGLNKNLSIGIGRSTYKKELDAFVKYRFMHQQTGKKIRSISLIYTAGITLNTSADVGVNGVQMFSDRVSHYHQLIAGRKFSSRFSFQLSPTYVHQNSVGSVANITNDVFAIGVGARYKLSNRVAILIDAFPVVSGGNTDFTEMPLSIGFDLETGGHVFQLHFSNSSGMNERAFINETRDSWTSFQFRLGFNLSRVFTVVKNKDGF